MLLLCVIITYKLANLAIVNKAQYSTKKETMYMSAVIFKDNTCEMMCAVTEPSCWWGNSE